MVKNVEKFGKMGEKNGKKNVEKTPNLGVACGWRESGLMGKKEEF